MPGSQVTKLWATQSLGESLPAGAVYRLMDIGTDTNADASYEGAIECLDIHTELHRLDSTALSIHQCLPYTPFRHTTIVQFSKKCSFLG